MQKEGSSSTIKVFVRVRPRIASQGQTDKVVQLSSDNRTVQVTHDSYNHMEIKFDHAFDPYCSQEDIFEHFYTVIPRVLDGYNVTMFAYGQTGSGKTYTMFGPMENQEKVQTITMDREQQGVIPRAIEQIFDKISGYKNASVYCSFLQIYNEKIYDLLQDIEKPKPLSIHESKAQGIFVQGLTQFGVNKGADCLQLLMKGVKNRVIRQTSMNAKSSRSHSIFQILVEIKDVTGNYLKGRLNLCDLAGSEKINKKEAMGDAQLKELKNINLSLTTLGKVIYALSSGDKKASGAFRQSKLTRLLQESLTGNTYTFIMANLSPSIKNLQETVNTLKFVERANHITLKVKQTQVANKNHDQMGKLQKEVQYLKELLQLKKQGVNPEAMPEQVKSLMRQNQHLKKEYVPKTKVETMVKQNRNMKKQIYNLQVQLEQTEGTQTSLESGYAVKMNKINREKDKKIKLDYYMPSSRGGPSERNSSESKRLTNSLIQAGKSIAFPNKQTIDSPTPTRSRNQENTPVRVEEKANLARRLQDFQDKRKNEEYKLMEQYEQYEKKAKGRYSPPPKMGGKVGYEQSHVIKPRKKKTDYSDKIKELEARLFAK